MAINVTCPGCHTRFTVADQHAGKEGPCPKCKKPITIPKPDEQVVIHAPTPDGPTDAQGRSVLKTFKKKDAVFDPMVATGVGVVVLLTLLAAFLLRGSEQAQNVFLLGGGAVLMGPLLSWAGYSFLRDQELQPHTGLNLWARCLGCGVAYALAWGAYVLIASQIGESNWETAGLELWQMAFAASVAILIGTFAAFAALDLEPMMAFLHCGMYFVVTVGLRWVMALAAVPGLTGEA